MLLLFYYCILLFPNNLILKKETLRIVAYKEVSIRNFPAFKLCETCDQNYAFFGNKSKLKGALQGKNNHFCNDWSIYAFSIFDGYFN